MITIIATILKKSHFMAFLIVKVCSKILSTILRLTCPEIVSGHVVSFTNLCKITDNTFWALGEIDDESFTKKNQL